MCLDEDEGRDEVVNGRDGDGKEDDVDEEMAGFISLRISGLGKRITGLFGSDETGSKRISRRFSI